ncbi:MAG: hypothetical protein AB9891_21650 [Anaerolineaceae bacterium]
MFSQFEDKGKIFTQVVSKKPVSVIIQTSKNRIHGKIHIRPEDRVKDELNRRETFIAVTDAVVYSPDNQVLFTSSFLTLNTEQIVWLIPEGELRDTQGDE